MNPERLKYLAQRYRASQCTPEEQEEFLQWYESLDDPAIPEVLPEGTSEAEEYVNEHYRRFTKRVHAGQRSKVVRFWSRIAAAVILVAIAGLSYWQLQKKFSHVNMPPAVVSYDVKPGKAVDSRYLQLSDGSIVILHAGSSLNVDTTAFNKTNREITLTGEAFFDVKHNAALPFVIHTGKTKTTVLGTAFNIRQHGDTVLVTVARGTVRVENDKKVLAVLKPGQQVAYSQQQQQTIAPQVKPEAELRWVQVGLSFQDATLKTIAQQLQDRYHIPIVLQTPALANCRVTVVTPFTGTESLDQLLAVICPIINASYIKEKERIVIQGQGCAPE